MRIDMRCCHAQHKGETWALELGEEDAKVIDAAGAVRTELTRAEAAENFHLPSFSESIKQFRVPVDGQLWYFDVAKPDLQQIKAYIDQSVVASGPEAVGAIRNRALRDGAIGLAALAIGIGITAFTLLRADANPEGGEYVVMYGPMIFGAIMIGRGVFGLMRYNRLKSVSQSETV